MNNVTIVLIVILLIGLVVLFVMSIMKRKKSGLDIAKNRNSWRQIEDTLNGGNSVTYQMAVLSADKLLDQVMKDIGIPGDTMGDRLKSAKNRFSNIDDVWFAHKLRNRIAHESEVKLNLVTAKKALGIFKKALKDLGAI